MFIYYFLDKFFFDISQMLKNYQVLENMVLNVLQKESVEKTAFTVFGVS